MTIIIEKWEQLSWNTMTEWFILLEGVHGAPFELDLEEFTQL